MKTINTILKSDIYGEILVIDDETIKTYPEIDTSWPVPPVSDINTKPLLKKHGELHYVWGVQRKDDKLYSVAMNGLICFPEHVDENFREGTFLNIIRCNKEIEDSDKVLVISCVSRHLMWHLLGKPRLYVYSRVDNENMIIACCAQSDEKVKMNKVITRYENYENSGETIALVELFKDLQYEYLVKYGYIDKTLESEVNKYLNSI